MKYKAHHEKFVVHSFLVITNGMTSVIQHKQSGSALVIDPDPAMLTPRVIAPDFAVSIAVRIIDKRAAVAFGTYNPAAVYCQRCCVALNP
jgi:hypothetical protein